MAIHGMVCHLSTHRTLTWQNHTLDAFPRILLNKTPNDGISNQSDEDKLGFTYDVLDRYIRDGEIEDVLIKNRIDQLHETNQFKLKLMPSFKFE